MPSIMTFWCFGTQVTFISKIHYHLLLMGYILGIISSFMELNSYFLRDSVPELYYDRGNHHEFVSLVKDLARPGEITQSQTYDFEFTHVEKPYESYTGQNVKLRQVWSFTSLYSHCVCLCVCLSCGNIWTEHLTPDVVFYSQTLYTNKLGSHVCRVFRYFLRATVIRRLNDITKEMDIVVHTLSTYPELNSSIKMEVGIEDCLHIEFEYNKSK